MEKTTAYRITKLKNSCFLSLTLTTFILIISSCSKRVDNLHQVSNADTNFVTEAEARKVALDRINILQNQSGEPINRSVTSIDTLVAVTTYKIPSFYIINYSSGGFAIISADKRMYPILAFSEVNTFDFGADNIPSGLLGWLSNVDETIAGLRNGVTSVDKTIQVANEAMWQNGFESIAYEPDPNQFSNCTQAGATSVEYETIGPFINTNWDQVGGYNDSLADIGCSGGQLPPTGCVATAMAQIMRYYQAPSSYNWVTMLNNSSTSETARLMRDIGNAVDMDYGCDGSSSDTQSEVASSFTGDFGYTSANFANYNYNTVESEIRNTRPVILRGGRDGGWWIFGRYVDGHAWVCDGLLRAQYYVCQQTYTPFSPNPILMKQHTYSTLHFHMNWGWGGSFNGYYAFNNFDPGGFTFNYKTGMVVNIRP